MIRAATVATIVCLWALPLAAQAQAQAQAQPAVEPPAPPFTQLGALNRSPQSWPRVVDRGELVFSEWDYSGNAYDIVALDPTDRSVTPLVRHVRDGRFLARDDRRIVILRKRSASVKVSARDAATGAELAHIDLRDGVSWAGIVGDELRIVQVFENGYGRSTKALTLDLATLEPTRSAELGGVEGVAAWRDSIVVLGRDLRVFDELWRQSFSIAIPELPHDRSSVCSMLGLQVHESIAVAITGCGVLVTFDLESRKVMHVIDAARYSVGVALSRGLLFTAARRRQDGSGPGRVFELATGKLLAVTTFPDAEMYASDGHLVFVKSEPYPRRGLTLYSFDAEAIRSGRWQELNIVRECTLAAERFSVVRDPYAAADRCEAAGVATLTRTQWSDPAFAPLMVEYGKWLAAGFDRYGEAIPILEALRPVGGGDAAFERALADARLKVRRLDRGEDGPLEPGELQAPLRAALSRSEQRLTTTAAPIDYSAVDGLHVFEGDLILATAYGCDSEDCAVRPRPVLDVLDRDTFASLARVTIPVKLSDDDQTSISGLALHDGTIWVAADYFWDDRDAPNLFAVDAKTFAITREAELDVDGLSLFSRDGALLACDCGPGGRAWCQTVDGPSLATKLIEEWRCDARDDGRITVAREPTPAFARAVTPNYFVLSERLDNGERELVPVPRADASAAPRFAELDHYTYPRVVEIPGADVALLVGGYNAAVSLSRYDIARGTSTMLGRFALARSENHDVIADAHHAYLALGRDLVIYEHASGRMLHYVQDFIPGGFVGENGGNDQNGIARLILDRDRLIAITMTGNAGISLDLRQLAARGEPAAQSSR